jgi:2-keto-4-pentenoate hydratase
MALTDAEVDAIADEVLVAADRRMQIAPFTESRPSLSVSDAYRISARVTARRIARGEHPIGWKIGFTNRTIWHEYGVHAPIWGPVYDSTATTFDPTRGPARCRIAHLLEPRIEPEIVFRIGSPPDPDMDEDALASTLDGVAHGVEVVQSIFPGWRFRAADTVAAFALHGALCVGPWTPLRDGPGRTAWLDRLSQFEIRLFRDDAEIDRGAGSNVLGGPLSALLHFVRGLAVGAEPTRLKPGDIVTTGTITRAFPVAPGEHWRTEVHGLPLPGMRIDFV